MGAAGILQTVKGEGKVFVIVWALPSTDPFSVCVSLPLSHFSFPSVLFLRLSQPHYFLPGRFSQVK